MTRTPDELRPVPGHGDYWVSDQGEVYALRRGRLKRLATALTNGYPRLTLVLGRKRRSEYVHTLVLLAFAGPRPPGQQARHLDGDPQNNARSNLAWGTPAEDARDRERHGSILRGDDHPNTKLTRAGLAFALAARSRGVTYQAISVVLGVHRTTIRCAVNRWTARHGELSTGSPDGSGHPGERHG